MRSDRRRRSPLAAIAPICAVIALACLLGGCGRLGASYKGMRLDPPTTIGPELAQYPADSPQRAVLEWYRAIQLGNVSAAATYYVGAARVTPTRVDRFRRSAFFSVFQPPRILSAWHRHGSTTVFTSLEARWSAPDGRSYSFTLPQGFELHRLGSAWKLGDDHFLRAAPASKFPRSPCAAC